MIDKESKVYLDGKPVEIESRQLTGNSPVVDMDLQVKFKAPVTKVETVIAAGLAERTFPSSPAFANMRPNSSALCALPVAR